MGDGRAEKSVMRRRQAGNMCSCRRRSDISTTGQYECRGNSGDNQDQLWMIYDPNERSATNVSKHSLRGSSHVAPPMTENKWNVTSGENTGLGSDTNLTHKAYQAEDVSMIHSSTIGEGFAPCGSFDGKGEKEISRRRESGVDMCSCRRRSGMSVTSKYFCMEDHMWIKYKYDDGLAKAPCSSFDGRAEKSVMRRRQAGNMCSCRRRSEMSTTGQYECRGNSGDNQDQLWMIYDESPGTIGEAF